SQDFHQRQAWRRAERTRIKLADRAFRLCHIADDSEFALTTDLVQQRYAWRGYQLENEVSRRPTHQLTFAAYHEESLIGTLTLRTDSDEGLLADELYRNDIDRYRGHRGAHCCELTRFALAPTRYSKEVFASLFHLAFIFGRKIHQVSDVFIEVNPRHSGFYRRMLGLSQVGAERTCKRVEAPAVLMHGELAYIEEQIREYGGCAYNRAKSLYPYFFSEQETQSVIEQLHWAQ
ncbi:MAG: putative long-chain N-acyl amino acid synthase, partial [Rhodocyclales bacterium]|nr:putative long-chain N-acyl amino acid synthase [Rhodocyclales bacterium]